VTGLAFNLLLLTFFKYFDFLLSNLWTLVDPAAQGIASREVKTWNMPRALHATVRHASGE
jgi:hypothetical protein